MSADEQGHNGWANYPTWAVNLWLSNEESLYRTAQDFTREAIEDVAHPTSEYWNVEQSTLYYLADYLKDWVEDDLTPDLGASFPADLLGWALGQVDWHEIAAHYIADHEPSRV
jgi:hypothetical protein